MIDWKKEKALVLGLARSGSGAVDLLLRLGSKPVGYDAKAPEGETAARLALWEEEGARIVVGEPEAKILDGIDRVVASPGFRLDHPLIRAAEERGIEVLSEIELAYRAADCPIVAISGTNGKSTTTTLIGEILRRDGRRVAVAGNIGRPLCDAVGPYRDYDIVVAEISSFQLETIRTFRPKVAVLLNITEDHLDRHGDFGEYARLKARLFENQGEGDFAVLNYDDPACRKLARNEAPSPVWISQSFFGRIPGVYLRFGEILSTLAGEDLVALERDITIPGPHNRTNALASVAAAKVLGVPNAVIRETLREFPGLEHRLERVAIVNGISFVNDSKATNVDSVYVALQSYDVPIVWIAGGRPKKPSFDKLRDLVAIHVRAMILIGEARRLLDEAFPNVAERYYANSMAQAVLIAYRVARKGDVVLLSPGCTSFDMFRDFEERGRVFKEEVGRLMEREKHDE
ncbi:MAG: UDP-N-acetylmuramoyl-L-alanine--D-glutamate ligase [Candidatus Latescibacterota bacterium]|nr:MAG: UDP-N-acetylmuramoyl-L-alanine--D-glutamate ligase [Candidatus Latescibacterota bacterium]